LRFALREMRGGLRGFYVFITCIALGVMAIAGVGSFTASLADGLVRDGRVILGGDIAFTLIQREANQQERIFLDNNGRLTANATMRAMARNAGGDSALVELKAVDASYPLYGTVVTDPAMPLREALRSSAGAFGAVADPAFLLRLDLPMGARVTIGSATFEIRASLITEPDKLASGIEFGPRFLISDEALRATGLLQPGTLVRWHYRLALPQAKSDEPAQAALTEQAQREFPDAGWQIRTHRNATPALERNVERFSQFLTLVGLTALLVGGVGVANAVKSHLDRKRDVIAVLKALGATSRDVFLVYFAQVLVLAMIGSALGLVVGAALPFVIVSIFGSMIPLPIAPALHPAELTLALIYGLLTAIAFALWPVGRTRDISVAALFRDEIVDAASGPRKSTIVMTGLVVAILATIAVALAYDRRIASIFIVAAGAVFLASRLIAFSIMAVARRLPRARSTVLRLAVSNIYRPGALTATVVLSLGLGLALLVTVVEIDGNLRRQFLAALPEKAPSFYFLDVRSAEAERFDAFIRQNAPSATLERVPMLRGRIVAANGVPVEQLNPSAEAAWVLQSDRGITYADEIPRGSRLVEGTWWPPDRQGPALVSFEKKLAEGLGLKLGDSVTVNVLGRTITAEIANMRAVDWQNLGINFVLVFSPAPFRGAPHTDIATLTYPAGSSLAQENELIKTMATAFPSVTVVRVKDALESIGQIVANLVLGIRGASLITLFAAILVLGGALAAGHRHRLYDAVVLKTLGATRPRLLAAYALEYLLLGTATALFGVVAGSIAAWAVLTRVMNLSFAWLPGPALTSAFVAVAITVALGLFGTFAALGQKPAPVLRNL